MSNRRVQPAAAAAEAGAAAAPASPPPLEGHSRLQPALLSPPTHAAAASLPAAAAAASASPASAANASALARLFPSDCLLRTGRAVAVWQPGYGFELLQVVALEESGVWLKPWPKFANLATLFPLAELASVLPLAAAHRPDALVWTFAQLFGNGDGSKNPELSSSALESCVVAADSRAPERACSQWPHFRTAASRSCKTARLSVGEKLVTIPSCFELQPVTEEHLPCSFIASGFLFPAADDGEWEESERLIHVGSLMLAMTGHGRDSEDDAELCQVVRLEAAGAWTRAPQLHGPPAKGTLWRQQQRFYPYHFLRFPIPSVDWPLRNADGHVWAFNELLCKSMEDSDDPLLSDLDLVRCEVKDSQSQAGFGMIAVDKSWGGTAFRVRHCAPQRGF